MVDVVKIWEELQEARIMIEAAHELKIYYVNEERNFELAAYYRGVVHESADKLFEYGKLTEQDKKRFNVKTFR
jgi:hypothetical protein